MAGNAGWYKLLGIIQESEAIQQQEAVRPVVACPNDGEPLQSGPDGQLFCRFDGWRPDQ